jgi:hypothetical protein
MRLTISRLKVGVDVPWVTSWSDEEILGVRPCPSVEGRLAICQAERPGVGKPNYSRNHHRRQRESIRGMLCPMCGEPTQAGDRWTQTATLVAAGALRAKGLGGALPPVVPDHQMVLDAGAISPSHRVCAERALEHCPHLRGQPDQTLRPFPQRWTTYPLMIAATPPGHALAAQPPAPIPVISFIQLCGVTDAVQRDWRQRMRAEVATRS